MEEKHFLASALFLGVRPNALMQCVCCDCLSQRYYVAVRRLLVEQPWLCFENVCGLCCADVCTCAVFVFTLPLVRRRFEEIASWSCTAVEVSLFDGKRLMIDCLIKPRPSLPPLPPQNLGRRFCMAELSLLKDEVVSYTLLGLTNL